MKIRHYNSIIKIISYIILVICLMYSIISLICGEFLFGGNSFIIVAFLAYLSNFVASLYGGIVKQKDNFKTSIEFRYYGFYVYFVLAILINAISLYFFVTGIYDCDVTILYSFIAVNISFIMFNSFSKLFRYLGLSSYSKRPYVYEVKYDDFSKLKKVISKGRWKKYSDLLNYEYVITDDYIFLSYSCEEMEKGAFLEYYMNKFNDFVKYLKENKEIDSEDNRSLVLIYNIKRQNDIFLNYVLNPIVQKYNYIYVPLCYVEEEKTVYIGRQLKYYKLSRYKNVINKLVKFLDFK